MTPPPELLDRLAGLSLDWNSLQRDAGAVILFGSRAAGVERADSDWDLLCVGSGRQRLTAGLDVLWVSGKGAAWPCDDWIGGELANHIARFGRVLFGERPWVENYDRQERAIARKRRQLAGHVRGLTNVWPRLNSFYRQRQLAQLRRDLQRYDILRASEPVPPTAMLDQIWCDGPDTPRRVLEGLDRIELASSELERVLIPARAKSSGSSLSPLVRDA